MIQQPKEMIPGICIVAVPETSGAVLYGLYDVLSGFASAWAEVMGQEQKNAEFEVSIVAESKQPFTCLGGVPVTPHASLEEINSTDVVIITDLGISPDVDHRNKWQTVKSWLNNIHRTGGTICSVCSGSVLLAGSGLLDDNHATTHWAYSDHLRHFYPDVKLEPGRVLIVTGEDDRIVTCGGMAAWEDLALFLVSRYYGEAMAVNVAKLYLFGDRSEGQLMFSAMSKPKRHEDAAISQSQRWLAEHYDSTNPVKQAVKRSGLAERSFKRRFKIATGYAPIDYVQTLRVEEAKHMLESTSEAIDYIAHQVGYEDPTSFRRLFKRQTGVTPGRYRQRFQAIRASALINKPIDLV